MSDASAVQQAPDELLTTDELAARWKVSAGHLRGCRSAGTGPAYIKLLGGVCRYRLGDIIEWEQQRTRQYPMPESA